MTTRIEEVGVIATASTRAHGRWDVFSANHSRRVQFSEMGIHLGKSIEQYELSHQGVRRRFRRSSLP